MLFKYRRENHSIEWNFFSKQPKHISIRIMIIWITVRDLEINKHQIDKYAIIFMYFENKNKSDIIVKTIIIREIHLIKDWKANLLIENNIFEFEWIDISTFISTIYIDNCEITIFIVINDRFRFQRLSIHVLKTTTIFSEIEYFVNIHNIILSKRDYFFELTSTANFSIYFHIVNSKRNFILMRNDIEKFITISRNFRLKMLNEMNYFNVYMIYLEVSNFAIKFLESKHQIFWFNKVLLVYAIIIFDF